MFNIIKIKYRSLSFNLGLIILFFAGCTEPFDTSGVLTSFESVIVIEATITNELKQQQIRLSRTFEFDDDEGAPPETNANVSVLDDQGNEITFLETEPGLYLSQEPFQAQANTAYQLSITTADGNVYGSSPETLPQVTPIGEVIAQRTTNEDDEEGMAILVNTFDPTNNSNFYRYEYEEAFLIIAPSWTPEDLVASTNPSICSVEVVNNGDNNEEVCYGENISNTIILTTTTGLVEDRVTQFAVRFIDRDNYILSHRYTILVRQFIQSSAAHNFFDTLNELSQSDNLFSQIQPGLLVGNVFSETSSNEIVLGYFDVSSVSEERIFFNYEDFFPGEPLPNYAVGCTPFAPPIFSFGSCGLAEFVRAEAVEYLELNGSPSEENPGPFSVVGPACGDCTVLGSNVKPSFWID